MWNFEVVPELLGKFVNPASECKFYDFRLLLTTIINVL
jgi:hypothetical protein